MSSQTLGMVSLICGLIGLAIWDAPREEARKKARDTQEEVRENRYRAAAGLGPKGRVVGFRQTDLDHLIYVQHADKNEILDLMGPPDSIVATAGQDSIGSIWPLKEGESDLWWVTFRSQSDGENEQVVVRFDSSGSPQLVRTVRHSFTVTQSHR
jgi:hypothetical protein